MRILSITAQKPHSTGSGFYLTELVNQWEKDGHRQAVVVGVYPEDETHFPEEVDVYRVLYGTEELPFAIAGMSDEMPYESTRYCDMTAQMVAQFRAAFRKAVERAVERLNPDLIVCHHLYLLTAMVREWYPDRKVIGICHGSDLRQISKNELERSYIEEHIRKLDKVTALQEEQRKKICQLFSLDKERVATVGAGYNADIFYRTRTEEKPFVQLVFAGKVSEKKGVFSLIRALEYLPYPADRLKVKIAGNSGVKEEYRAICKLAENSKYEIEFTGALPQQELAELFRQSDVFVLPSFFEGLALVNLEALACGCKVVCSDIPGMKDWYDRNVPEHGIEFVPLPRMVNTDEPLVEDLESYEMRLAHGIVKELTQPEEAHPQLDHISWKGISRNILKEAEGKTLCL